MFRLRGRKNACVRFFVYRGYRRFYTDAQGHKMEQNDLKIQADKKLFSIENTASL